MIVEFDHEANFSADCRDVVAQGRNQHVAALLQPRNAVLTNIKPFSDCGLRFSHRLPRLPQGHLLQDQLVSASEDLCSPCFGQFRQ